MPAWGLKLGSFVITLAVLLGSSDYARAHLKNPAAPLQPPVADKSAPSATAPRPTATPLPSLLPTRRGAQSSSPGPALTLQPGVRATALPSITITHVS